MMLIACIVCIVCACNDTLDIVQSYGYHIETLPLPKSLKKGASVDLEFSIVREGFYKETTYKFRYFQSEGEGILTCQGYTVRMNHFQEIVSDNFILTYQCTIEGQQQLDFVFEDSFGKRVEYTVTFSGDDRTEEEKE
jgi:hypothetical protein